MDKQLSLFSTLLTETKKTPTVQQKMSKPTPKTSSVQTVPHFTLCVDGASRGNPGPAGAGIYITYDNEPVLKKGIFLGEKTNNQAEYLALTLGLFFLKQLCLEKKIQHPHVAIISDSELLIKQMKGEYALKNKALASLKALAEKLIDTMSYHCKHVLREYNKEADKLANLGIDKKHKIPTDFLKILSDYGLFV